MFNRSLIVAAVLFGAVGLARNAAQAATVEGSVKGLDGKPVAGAEVRIEISKTKQLVGTVKTDKSGRYIFKRLAEGTVYKLTTRINKVDTSVDNVTTREEGAARVDLDAKAAAAGKKKSKHWVWMPQETGSHLGGRWVEVDENGRAAAGVGNSEVMSGKSLEAAGRGKP